MTQELFDASSGWLRFTLRNTLEHLSTLHASIVDYLKELVDNCIDAGSETVWVTLTPKSLTVIDEGHGMVPTILPDDRTKIQTYIQALADRRTNPDVDLRSLISETSRNSLEWMATMTAFSGKVVEQTPRVKGVKGIGIQGFRPFGEATWLTKPSETLAARYYLGERPKIKNPPVYSLRLPTMAEIRRNQLEPTIEESKKPFLDPEGHILDQGTVAQITGLKPEIESTLNPQAMVNHLTSRFGEEIRSNRVKIYVIDRVTKEGQTSKTGLFLEVPPARYRGVLILDRELHLRGSGNPPFQPTIYYDSAGRNLAPVYLRRGSEVQAITTLPEFQRAPWNSGKLNGIIPFPDLPETVAPWDTNKMFPMEGPVRNQWQHAIWNVAPEIEAAIKEVDEEERTQRQNEANKAVVEATTKAMRELPLYRGLTVDTTPPTPRGPRDIPYLEDRVLVSVQDDETNQGVGGVTVQLWLLPYRQRQDPAQVIIQRETGKSGQISFGRVMESFGQGPYRLQIIIPQGMKPADNVQEQTINLGPNQPGIRFIFRIVSGQPKVESQRVRSFTLRYTDQLPDTEPYSAAYLESGIIMINKVHPDYRAAEEAGNRELIDTLLANCIAHAITEYGLKNHPQEVQLAQAALLFARALSHIHGGRRRRS